MTTIEHTIDRLTVHLQHLPFYPDRHIVQHRFNRLTRNLLTASER